MSPAAIARLTISMIEHEGRCVERVGHLLRVYGFAKTIGEAEGLDAATQFTLEAAALTHDIGIKMCLEKYRSAAGNLQQIEGPPIARAMLEALDFPPEVVQRVCYLVSRHHTYEGIDGPDYQMLIEADFLVNIFDGGMDKEAVAAVRRDVFKTQTGAAMLDVMY